MILLSDGRNKRLAFNAVTSLLLQIAVIINGFIIPRLILESYGSEVNGLVNSVTQFLGVISLLDLGVGAVVQTSLYKPLADNDIAGISRIYVSAGKFFKRIALILIVYSAVLMIFYPLTVKGSFGHFYSASLTAIIAVSSFAQYYFGVVNGLLLSADQKGYIQYSVQIVTVIINTVVCAVLMKCGFSVHIMKLAASLTFVVRPLFLYFYVGKHYKIDKTVTYTEEPIKQKWNGMAQHFAAFVLSGTDSIVLTLFSTLENVSVYSVYNTVILGVKNLLMSLTNGFQSLTGEMIAKRETDKLYSFFAYTEWFFHTATTLIFGCTGVLLVSFVRVYTSGVDDADYIQPLFAFLITAANAGHCLRLPYNILILAAGHYKQTQSNYIIAMIMNIVISAATVKLWGLIGVAVGTLAAMVYQTVWMAWYDSKNIIRLPFGNFLKQCGADILTVIISSIATYKIPLLSVSYMSWVLQAAEVFIVWLMIALVINLVFYKENILNILEKAEIKLGNKNGY